MVLTWAVVIDLLCTCYWEQSLAFNIVILLQNLSFLNGALAQAVAYYIAAPHEGENTLYIITLQQTFPPKQKVRSRVSYVFFSHTSGNQKLLDNI